MDIERFIYEERLRADAYRLLSASFYQPQIDILKEENLLSSLSKVLRNTCQPASVYADEMERLLLVYTEEELLVDYARLFVGPNELLAAPYGSVYIDEGRRLMGDSTMAVIDFYKSHGLVMGEGFKEMPDHIVVELEFMYYLVFNEVMAIERTDFEGIQSALKAQAIFLNKFLRTWVRQFSQRIIENAETHFYKALARCLNTFIYNTETPTMPEGIKLFEN